MTHNLARTQAILFGGWLLLWLAGRILPGGLGRFAYTTRNLLFLLLSAVTIWIGYWMAKRHKKLILFFMAAHLWLYRRYLKPEQTAALLRYYKRSLTQQQTGEVLLLVGGISLAVGLYYFFW